jgi:NAD-dependent SIR2 family protein deacetylase
MSSLLTEFIAGHESIFVLTGAGISTASGIPDYRDESGDWKQQKPMEYRDFVDHYPARQRYWARSFIGWQRFGRARPNQAHDALARLEQLNRIAHTVTQNVDGLHQRAGSRRLTELHGSLATVVCMDCGVLRARELVQQQLLENNPVLANLSAHIAPDGDACLDGFDESSLIIPGCVSCAGILKPQVVFFGETVPVERVRECFDALRQADAMLVIGSSLMVYSGFRFVRTAQDMGIPIMALNRGKTRADELLTLKLELDCGAALNAALKQLDPDTANFG